MDKRIKINVGNLIAKQNRKILINNIVISKKIQKKNRKNSKDFQKYRLSFGTICVEFNGINNNDPLSKKNENVCQQPERKHRFLYIPGQNSSRNDQFEQKNFLKEMVIGNLT